MPYVKKSLVIEIIKYFDELLPTLQDEDDVFDCYWDVCHLKNKLEELIE